MREADRTYPLVTDESFPGPGVMRCADCERDLPVGSPFTRKPDSMIGDTPADLIVCVYCGAS